MIFNKAFLQRNESSERAEFLCKKALLNIMIIFCPRTGNFYVCPEELSTFRQTCQAEGFPPPVLNWTRFGMPLPEGKTEVKDGSLTIKNLSPADSGAYECVATNSMGTKKAKMNVAVQRQPKGLYNLKHRPLKKRASRTLRALVLSLLPHSQQSLHLIHTNKTCLVKPGLRNENQQQTTDRLNFT